MPPCIIHQVVMPLCIIHQVVMPPSIIHQVVMSLCIIHQVVMHHPSGGDVSMHHPSGDDACIHHPSSIRWWCLHTSSIIHQDVRKGLTVHGLETSPCELQMMPWSIIWLSPHMHINNGDIALNSDHHLPYSFQDIGGSCWTLLELQLYPSDYIMISILGVFLVKNSNLYLSN